MILALAACRGAEAPPPVVDAAPRAAILRKPGRRDPKWANARCNDGTAFAYAVRPGSDTWVVNLAGGFFCDDEVHLCKDRAPRLTRGLPGEDGGPAPVRTGGVFSDDPAIDPTFAGATQVDAHYCSSDLWLGDSIARRPTTADPQGWYFAGRENVRVLLESLREVDGLDESDPRTRILLVGTSAGAAGVVGNLDQFAAAWPHAVAERRLRVVLDGGWVAPPPAGVALPDASRWGPPEPDCVRDGVDPRTCVLGPVWWPYVARRGIPVLVQISAQDRTQTPVFGIDTPEELAAWRTTVRASLEEAHVPWVFSGGTPYHCVATEGAMRRGPPGSSFREVLDRFWADGPPEQVIFDQ